MLKSNLSEILPANCNGPYQWCSKTTKLQDQDHLFFQDQDRSGQETIKLLTQDHWRSQKFWLGGAQFGKMFVTLFWWRILVTQWWWPHWNDVKIYFEVRFRYNQLQKPLFGEITKLSSISL